MGDWSDLGGAFISGAIEDGDSSGESGGGGGTGGCGCLTVFIVCFLLFTIASMVKSCTG